MAAYLAPSLVVLRNEINAANPKRDKSSDGWIGDKAHQARKSDHNPDPLPNGVVRATDTDKDGTDMAKLLAIARKDPRVQYIIWEGHIYSRSTGFKKQKYTGSNGHFGHMHLSLRHGKQYETDTRPWGYAVSGGVPSKPAPAPGKLTVDQVATEVIAGRWGSGPERAVKLKNAGYNPAAVQAEVNRRLTGGAPKLPSVPARKSLAEIAGEVLAGRWGEGEDRKNKLKAAGWDPAVVQVEVNARLKGGGSPPVNKPSIEQVAKEVLAGKWGNGPDRIRRLQEQGYSPTAVQAAVNKLAPGGAAAPVKPSVTILARQVLKGQWGNGPERERRLAQAGHNPAAVQAEVNRLS